jgi:2-keto-4-pentenoate hydratase/2-oxohepta-3-ene-1,7-dioic acid hydratase in catechol pathway
MSELIFTDGTALQIGTIYCIGKNYAKHAAEMGSGIPKDPIVFLKPAAAYVADGGSINYPEITNELHHEVELVIAIGKDCGNTTLENAWDCVAGTAVGLDITMRDQQRKAKEKGLPWTTAKAFKTSAPISKIVPVNELNGQKHFDLQLKVNGELRQSANTIEMERPVEQLIKYLDDIFSLKKGDLIFTGTPEGIGEIHKGDKLEAELKGFAALSADVI